MKIVFIKSLKSKFDFISLFKIFKRYGYNRILLESGLIFLNSLLKNKLIYNLYVFQSSKKLGRLGMNNAKTNFIIKKNLMKRIIVNLKGDNFYRVKFK